MMPLYLPLLLKNERYLQKSVEVWKRFYIIAA